MLGVSLVEITLTLRRYKTIFQVLPLFLALLYEGDMYKIGYFYIQFSSIPSLTWIDPGKFELWIVLP